MKFDNTVALFTCSYGPDFGRCERLCGSIDKQIDADIEHIVVVPKRDLPTFQKLASARRRIISTESLIPGRYVQLPFINKWWLDSRGWPVRGWIMQQITKLSACFATDAKVIMHVDSDIQFIRPLNKERLYTEGKARINRRPGQKQEGEHLNWHRVASELLGIEPEYSGADYIGPLTTWRNDDLRSLLKHIETISRDKWYFAVGHKLRFSEYILYGQYVDRVLDDDSKYFETDKYHCYCVWYEEDMQALISGEQSIDPDDIAILIQSNLSLPFGFEEAFLLNAQKSV